MDQVKVNTAALDMDDLKAIPPLDDRGWLEIPADAEFVQIRGQFKTGSWFPTYSIPAELFRRSDMVRFAVIFERSHEVEMAQLEAESAAQEGKST